MSPPSSYLFPFYLSFFVFQTHAFEFLNSPVISSSFLFLSNPYSHAHTHAFFNFSLFRSIACSVFCCWFLIDKIHLISDILTTIWILWYLRKYYGKCGFNTFEFLWTFRDFDQMENENALPMIYWLIAYEWIMLVNACLWKMLMCYWISLVFGFISL